MDADQLARLQSVAHRHAGVFGTDEAVALGIDDQILRRARSRGALVKEYPSVWRFPAAQVTEVQRIWASLLQVGTSAIASHEAALHLHGVRHVVFRPAVIVAPTGNHRHSPIRVHRMGDVLDEHRIVLDGIPTTTLARALIDVTSVFSRRRLEDVLDRVTITQRMTSVGAVARVLRQVNRRGRRNIRQLQVLLDARRPAEAAPRSRVERRVDELLETTDLPDPLREYPLPGADPGSAFVDRAWPEAKLILEVDGRSWHARERAMAKDRARDRAAGRVGWHTMRVLDEEVTEVAPAIRGDVVETYRERLVQLGGS